MHRFNLIPDMKKASQIMQEKVFLVVMTSSMTSQGDLKVAPLYSLINEKWTFSVITEKRTTTSSLNLVSISLWICLYELVWNILLMTSSDPKIYRLIIFIKSFLTQHNKIQHMIKYTVIVLVTKQQANKQKENSYSSLLKCIKYILSVKVSIFHHDILKFIDI